MRRPKEKRDMSLPLEKMSEEDYLADEPGSD